MKQYRNLSSYKIPHWGIVLEEIFSLLPDDPLRKPDVDWSAVTTKDLAEASFRSVPEVEETLVQVEKGMSFNVEISMIEFDAFFEMAKSPHDLLILDVRSREAFSKRTIPGALLLQDISKLKLPDLLKSASKVVCVCNHGVRSYSAAIYLRSQGFQDVYSLQSGIDFWFEFRRTKSEISSATILG